MVEENIFPSEKNKLLNNIVIKYIAVLITTLIFYLYLRKYA